MAKKMLDIGLVPVAGGEDVMVAAGDWVSVESTAAHQEELILNSKGDFKQNPTICVGAFDYLDDEGVGALVQEISDQFSGDGMDVKSVAVDAAGVVESVAWYK